MVFANRPCSRPITRLHMVPARALSRAPDSPSQGAHLVTRAVYPYEKKVLLMQQVGNLNTLPKILGSLLVLYLGYSYYE